MFGYNSEPCSNTRADFLSDQGSSLTLIREYLGCSSRMENEVSRSGGQDARKGEGSMCSRHEMMA